MVGFGPEDKNFVLELTYNYGISTYRHGDSLDTIDIEKQDVALARNRSRADTIRDDGSFLLINNGYRFRIFPGSEGRRGSLIRLN